MHGALIVFLLLVSLQHSSSFSIGIASTRWRSRSCLFMGRAAAVRADTKARTDAAKAKNNNRFAKKIIMAVKAGGPDTTTNTQLAQVRDRMNDSLIAIIDFTHNSLNYLTHAGCIGSQVCQRSEGCGGA